MDNVDKDIIVEETMGTKAKLMKAGVIVGAAVMATVGMDILRIKYNTPAVRRYRKIRGCRIPKKRLNPDVQRRISDDVRRFAEFNSIKGVLKQKLKERDWEVDKG